MTARLLRWLLVTGPVRVGEPVTGAVYLTGLVTGAWLATSAWHQPYLMSLVVGAFGVGAVYAAGLVWRWRIRVQRAERPDRWREREVRNG